MHLWEFHSRTFSTGQQERGLDGGSATFASKFRVFSKATELKDTEISCLLTISQSPSKFPNFSHFPAACYPCVASKMGQLLPLFLDNEFETHQSPIDIRAVLTAPAPARIATIASCPPFAAASSAVRPPYAEAAVALTSAPS
jgi:hypothetical protein